jgi:hypothetical protein
MVTLDSSAKNPAVSCLHAIEKLDWKSPASLVFLAVMKAAIIQNTKRSKARPMALIGILPGLIGGGRAWE